jgi:hypothetical protein
MKIKLVLYVAFFFVTVINAQIYTPSGTIQGASTNSNVGIGTTSPITKLEVFQAANTSALIVRNGITSSYNSLYIGNDSSTNSSFLGSYKADDSNFSNLVLQKFGGNVGIGTNTPITKFEVFQATNTSAIAVRNGITSSYNSLYMGNDSSTNSSFLGSYKADDSNFSNLVLQKFGGNVGIGTNTPINKLDVNGTIHSKEVKVDMIGWSDFVFKKEYNLPTLQEVEKHIKEKGYLENVPSEEEVLKNGINLGEMDAKLLQKIEEMTLYMIEQNKKIEKQADEMETIKKENESFKVILERLSKIENKLK